jgi:hypothetical protein
MNSRARWYSKLKKNLFLPYALLIIPCLVGTIKLLITRKSWVYCFHLPLSIYTAVQIVYNQGLKLLGYKPKLKSYDGKKVISNP